MTELKAKNIDKFVEKSVKLYFEGHSYVMCERDDLLARGIME